MTILSRQRYTLCSARHRPFMIGPEFVAIKKKKDMSSLYKNFIGDEIKFLQIYIHVNDFPVLC